MYSVIIQNKETTEAFSVYKPLFMDAENNGSIGFCAWIESGATIDKALPGIRELTDDKEEWRAIIVRTESDIDRCNNVDYIQNPYDYAHDENFENELEESRIPLIRLTHMLGGVPAIEKQFQSVLIEEDNKAPRIVYQPVENAEQDVAFKKLQQMYVFDGVLPSSILIITIRETENAEQQDLCDWVFHSESESSNFWKRNRYPSICRFLVFDMVKQGPVRREESMFRFWLSVLMLSINKIDSSALQAYRLYRVGISIDADLMEETFQQTVNRLASVKAGIKSEIRREMRGNGTTDMEVPDYRTDIPVMFEIPKNVRYAVKPYHFRAISDNPAADITTWNMQKSNVEDSLIKCIKEADRELDKTAGRMKRSCKYDEDMVTNLDPYQRIDLIEETDNLHSNLIKLQGNLPTSSFIKDNDAEKLSKNIADYLRGRITLSPVIRTFALIILLVLCIQIPAVIQYFQGKDIPVKAIASVSIISIGIMFVCGIVTLFHQKVVLHSMINTFNKNMKNKFNKIQANVREYSRYLSAIASYSRGKSYLELSNKKIKDLDGIKNMRRKHLDAIDLLLYRLETWGRAFHLDVDYRHPEVNEEITVDVMMPPIESSLYSIEAEKNHEVEINKSGVYISSPFAFINKFELVREELYDDENR